MKTLIEILIIMAFGWYFLMESGFIYRVKVWFRNEIDVFDYVESIEYQVDKHHKNRVDEKIKEIRSRKSLSNKPK